jgi:hypothetical protein
MCFYILVEPTNQSRRLRLRYSVSFQFVRFIQKLHTSLSVGFESGPFSPRFSSFNRAKVARSLEYPHRPIRASIPVRTAVMNSVLARIASETLSCDGIVFQWWLLYIVECRSYEFMLKWMLSCAPVGNMLVN